MLGERFKDLKQRNWYYPAVYGVLSALMAALITFFDRNVSNIDNYKLLTTMFISVDLSASILNMVALISNTILTFTFSTTMVVLTNFSSQYSPFVVENFLKNTIAMKALGVFFGSFVYTTTAMLLLDMNMQQDKVSVASFCLIYVVIVLIYFLNFINAVIMYIQPTGIIVKLREEAEYHIDNYVKLLDGKEVLNKENIPVDEMKNVYNIRATMDGYIQQIDEEKIKDLLFEYDCKGVFSKVVGEFVTIDEHVLMIYSKDPLDQEAIDHIQEDISEYMNIGIVRTGNQDFLFSIQKIMDIGTQSISDKDLVYDPNSSLDSMNIIKVLLRKIGSFEDGFRMEYDKDKNNFVAFATFNFFDILEEIFDPVVNYGKSNATMVAYIFNALSTILNRATVENKEKVLNYAEHIYNVIKDSDQPYLHDKYEKAYEKLMEMDPNKENLDNKE